MTVLVAAAALVGCSSSSGPEADTAWVEIEGEERAVMDVEECGLDDRAAFLLAVEGEATLQVVVVLDEEDGAVLDEVAATLFREPSVGAAPAVGAIGAAAAPKLGVDGPVGEVVSARLRGARLQVTVEAEVLDPDLGGTGEPGGELQIDANCPAAAEA